MQKDMRHNIFFSFVSLLLMMTFFGLCACSSDDDYQPASALAA